MHEERLHRRTAHQATEIVGLPKPNEHDEREEDCHGEEQASVRTLKGRCEIWEQGLVAFYRRNRNTGGPRLSLAQRLVVAPYHTMTAPPADDVILLSDKRRARVERQRSRSRA